MIITRTPFRISFLGGGTDYPAWYENYGPGAVLSATIDKFCYLTCRYLPPFFEHRYKISYSGQELVSSIGEIRHPSVRETLRFLRFDRGLSISHDGDLPSRTGLGTSSSFTVGLLNALYGLKGGVVGRKRLALEAIEIEQKRIGENVGSQDQTAAAFGGFNKIEFGGAEMITVNPVSLSQDRISELQNRLMLFFTGFSRNASDIAADQIKEMPGKCSEMRSLMEMVDEGIAILNSNGKLERFGKLLGEAWQIKRSLSTRISNERVEEIYSAAISAGATGGKLLGAGGGGFILFFTEPENQPKVRGALAKLLEVPFSLEFLGSQIIYSSHSD